MNIMAFKKGQSGNVATQFSSENQPTNSGRKGKSTTEYLREMGNASAIEFEIKIHGSTGRPKIKKGKVTSATTMNQLLATLLWADALQGDGKARKEILDRIEGKSKQTVDLKATVTSDIGLMSDEETEKRIEELLQKFQTLK